MPLLWQTRSRTSHVFYLPHPDQLTWLTLPLHPMNEGPLRRSATLKLARPFPSPIWTLPKFDPDRDESYPAHIRRSRAGGSALCVLRTDRDLCLNDRTPAALVRLMQCKPQITLYCSSRRSSLRAAKITVRGISRSSCCPTCGTDNHRVHSRYQRRIANLPLAGRSVRPIAKVCCFGCATTQCGQKIFTEQFPTGVLAPWTCRTGHLDVLVQHLGSALGGRPVAILAKRLMLPVSNDTLLKVVRRRRCPISTCRTRPQTLAGHVVDDVENTEPPPCALWPSDHERSPGSGAGWVVPAPAQVPARRRRDFVPSGDGLLTPIAVKPLDLLAVDRNILPPKQVDGLSLRLKRPRRNVSAANRERQPAALAANKM